MRIKIIKCHLNHWLAFKPKNLIEITKSASYSQTTLKSSLRVQGTYYFLKI